MCTTHFSKIKTCLHITRYTCLFVSVQCQKRTCANLYFVLTCLDFLRYTWQVVSLALHTFFNYFHFWEKQTTNTPIVWDTRTVSRKVLCRSTPLQGHVLKSGNIRYMCMLSVLYMHYWRKCLFYFSSGVMNVSY